MTGHERVDQSIQHPAPRIRVGPRKHERAVNLAERRENLAQSPRWIPAPDQNRMVSDEQHWRAERDFELLLQLRPVQQLSSLCLVHTGRTDIENAVRIFSHLDDA